MGQTLARLRAGLAATAAVVLLTACAGSGESRSAPSGPAKSTGSGTATMGPAVPVGSAVVFVGDFETGDFRQWSRCQNRIFSDPCHNMREDFYGMQIVSSGARQGRYAARFELRDGDQPSFGGGERAEVSRYRSGLVHEGEERWYEFSLMFDPEFPAETGRFFIVMQWHGADDAPPPMTLEVSGDGQLVLTGHLPEAPPMVIGDIARGEWVDYVVHATFSRDSAKGWAEVYRNGVLTVPRHARANMNSNFDYLKVGLYRDGQATSTAVLWVDGFRVTAPVRPDVGG